MKTKDDVIDKIIMYKLDEADKEREIAKIMESDSNQDLALYKSQYARAQLRIIRAKVEALSWVLE